MEGPGGQGGRVLFGGEADVGEGGSGWRWGMLVGVGGGGLKLVLRRWCRCVGDGE